MGAFLRKHWLSIFLIPCFYNYFCLDLFQLASNLAYTPGFCEAGFMMTVKQLLFVFTKWICSIISIIMSILFVITAIIFVIGRTSLSISQDPETYSALLNKTDFSYQARGSVASSILSLALFNDPKGSMLVSQVPLDWEAIGEMVTSENWLADNLHLAPKVLSTWLVEKDPLLPPLQFELITVKQTFQSQQGELAALAIVHNLPICNEPTSRSAPAQIVLHCQLPGNDQTNTANSIAWQISEILPSHFNLADLAIKENISPETVRAGHLILGTITVLEALLPFLLRLSIAIFAIYALFNSTSLKKLLVALQRLFGVTGSLIFLLTAILWVFLRFQLNLSVAYWFQVLPYAKQTLVSDIGQILGQLYIYQWLLWGAGFWVIGLIFKGIEFITERIKRNIEIKAAQSNHTPTAIRRVFR